MSFFEVFGRRLSQTCVLLVWLAVPFSSASPAWADDATGTVIVTLNIPVAADGSPGIPYQTYYLQAVRKDGHASARFRWENGWAVRSPDDLAASGGHGVVMIKEDLSPGDWELDTFRLETSRYPIRTRWFPRNKFSIPFRVEPGRATYIGSYQPLAFKYKNLLGMEMFGGGRFVVTDQSARDLPIAKTKMSAPMPIDVDVFDVDTLGNPLLSRGAASAAPDASAFSDQGPD